jgi:hypothetical protein
MEVITSRWAAEEFVSGDPFVINGVLSGWKIREWDEAFGSASAPRLPMAELDLICSPGNCRPYLLMASAP